jgi:hypothetical protein
MMDKWDYMKLKTCTTKEMVSKLEEITDRVGENLRWL